MNLTEKFLQLAAVGSEWILWLLIILSLISVGIMFERWLFYRTLAGKDTALLRTLHEALADGEIDRADRMVKVATAPGGRIASAMLDNRQRGATAMSSIMSAMRPAEKLRLEKNLSFLGTVGANAPFIGLLGTVLGIITTFLNSFQGLSSDGGGGLSSVAGGISEALVATAVGLLVAIPAVVVYNVYQRRVKLLLGEADALTNMVHALLVGDTSKE